MPGPTSGPGGRRYRSACGTNLGSTCGRLVPPTAKRPRTRKGRHPPAEDLGARYVMDERAAPAGAAGGRFRARTARTALCGAVRTPATTVLACGHAAAPCGTAGCRPRSAG